MPERKMIDPLLIPIIGTPSRNLNRLPDINDNILAVRSEFVGKPEVCHRLVKHIIHIRRDVDTDKHTEHFYDILERYIHVILKEYDIRWLLSICDTIIDTADVTRSAIAMNIVQCINRCNIDRTILANAVNGDLDLNKLRHDIKVPTWGGMITADIPSGDMIHNMMLRLDSVVANDELLNSIWCEIKDRSRGDDAIVMTHLCRASRFAHQREFFK